MQLSKKKLKRMRADLLAITPDIHLILDDIEALQKMKLPKTKKDGEQTSQAELEATGIAMVKEAIDMLLVRQYDGIVKILATINEIDPDVLEEKELGEIVDMIFEMLSDKMLFRFFPRLRRLVLVMQSDT